MKVVHLAKKRDRLTVSVSASNPPFLVLIKAIRPRYHYFDDDCDCFYCCHLWWTMRSIRWSFDQIFSANACVGRIKTRPF